MPYRWWYVIDWPTPSRITTTPPPRYESLPGFPGVHICVEGDEMGRLLDSRDHENCPNLVNLSRKSSDELIALLSEVRNYDIGEYIGEYIGEHLG